MHFTDFFYLFSLSNFFLFFVFVRVEIRANCVMVSIENCLDSNHRIVEHGDFSITGCVNCTCNDGVLTCAQIVCPQLSCPPATQIQETNQCCKFCPGDKKSIDENIINTSLR